MKVLVSDEFSPQGVEILQKAKGVEVDVKTGLSPEELRSIIGEYDGLVVRSATKVTADIIDAATNLKVIGRAGVGVDNIDVAAASKKGIVVMNTPGGNSMAAAEHTIALMFAIARSISQAAVTMWEKKWEKKRFMGMEVFGKTLGVIGLGNIGGIVADRGRGLKMKVIAYDPYASPDLAAQKGIEMVSLDELFARSDFVTVHVPKSKETENLIDAKAISKMKDGVMVINCARGGIVDEKALAEACRSGKVRAAAVDVFTKEPPPPDNPLLGVENIVCTPHLGAATSEAQENVAIDIAHQMAAYLTEGTVRNAVNVHSVDAQVLATLGPFLNLGQKMGGFFAQTCPFPLKELIIEYQGEVTAHNVAPISSAVLVGILKSYMDEQVNDVNAPFIAKERGITFRESKITEAADFTSLITLRAKADGKTHQVAGTLFGKKEPRLVVVNEYLVEAIPAGNILLVDTLDEPGVIGNIGAALGKKEINIGNMQFGRDKKGGKSLCILHLDMIPTSDVLDELSHLPNVNSVRLIQL
ncbi:MAG: phosphoglycerate dehydrogenase [Deltaproteobacteria bacterium RBG_13_52_11]|nr:MAG: phosphoglycerate dehydrogenase [Deltaproteobacteria bacterium RBG_13_52_11]